MVHLLRFLIVKNKLIISFNKNGDLDFYIGKKIFNNDVYNELCDVRNIEGKNTAWVVVDCHDVLVHVFTSEEREHFNLEKMYLDIPTLNADDYR